MENLMKDTSKAKMHYCGTVLQCQSESFMILDSVWKSISDIVCSTATTTAAADIWLSEQGVRGEQISWLFV